MCSHTSNSSAKSFASQKHPEAQPSAHGWSNDATKNWVHLHHKWQPGRPIWAAVHINLFNQATTANQTDKQLTWLMKSNCPCCSVSKLPNERSLNVILQAHLGLGTMKLLTFCLPSCCHALCLPCSQIQCTQTEALQLLRTWHFAPVQLGCSTHEDASTSTCTEKTMRLVRKQPGYCQLWPRRPPPALQVDTIMLVSTMQSFRASMHGQQWGWGWLEASESASMALQWTQLSRTHSGPYQVISHSYVKTPQWDHFSFDHRYLFDWHLIDSTLLENLWPVLLQYWELINRSKFRGKSNSRFNNSKKNNSTVSKMAQPLYWDRWALLTVVGSLRKHSASQRPFPPTSRAGK